MEVDTCLCVSLSCGEFTARTERLEAVFENISQTNVVKYWTFKGVVGVFLFRLFCFKVMPTSGASSDSCGFKLPLRDKSSLPPYMFSVAALGAVSLALMVSTLPARARQRGHSGSTYSCDGVCVCLSVCSLPVLAS